MSRTFRSGGNAALLVALAIWVLAQILGVVLDAPKAVIVDQLPRTTMPPPIRRVGQLEVNSARRGQISTGSAWHTGNGIWISNRHVVEQCEYHELGTGRSTRVEKLWLHPDADIAVAAGRNDRPDIPLADHPPKRGDGAVAVGYPQGQPGVVELRLMAESQMRLTGQLRSEHPFRTKVWGVQSLPQHVSHAGQLAGISGGVLVNSDGEAIGVAFGGNARRALLLAIPLSETRAAARHVREIQAGHLPHRVSDNTFLASPNELLRSEGVARVICRH